MVFFRIFGSIDAPMDIVNPRTGLVDHQIVPLDSAAVGELASRLRAAQPAWAARPMAERLAILARFSDVLGGPAGAAIADALEIDTGRRKIAQTEVMSVRGMVARWSREAPALVQDIEKREIDTALPGVRAGTRLHAYPLVGVISPWNFPLILSMIDSIPALVAGCAVLIKPSEIAPRFIRTLVAAIAQVPALAEVLAVIEGGGATGAALIDAVDYVAFTGSVPTGRKVGAAAAAAFIPASLELGGKDPMIVLESADPHWAAGIALRSSVLANGQACQSIERVYVARSIAAPFLDELAARAEAVRINWPAVDSGDIGPFIDGRQADIVQAQIDDALAHGARLHTGGKVEVHGGKWLRPTVIADVHPAMMLMREETFGPVIPVTIFDTVEEAVALANGGIFGLSAAVLAGSLAEAEAVGVQLHAGAISLNDGALTSLIGEAEKSSFGLSGLGASRMGASGLLRFYRRQALLRQYGTPMPLAAWAEDTAA
jgi:acyl-CoA reductase-like NAD-dependent aldehyde dehydrogenase